ncbi:MAG: hypothetical protein WCT49_05100 [Candidatus Paceibacterota bacterium]|jgi:hypothetical protein
MPLARSQETKTLPPWPYQTMERWLNAKVEGEKPRKTKRFYPDFMEDVFAAVV